jgi:transposase InsO family protein
MDTITIFPPPSHVYFRPTTVGQRRLLFSTAEETGNVSEASRRAHVSRGTYYYWRPRYESEGAAGLAAERSRAPHRTRIPSVSADLRAEVLAYHQAHPTEGYRSIANGIGKAHQWKKMISHTKVQEIILADREAHAPPPAPAAPPVESFHLPTEAVHAPKPNQTINIDLCVVPLEHDGTPDMVSVSLSAAAAGVIPTENGSPATSAEWPGQAFENPTLSYEEQMRDYVEKRTAKRLSKGQRKHRRRQKQAERAELNAQSDELRLKRRRQRARRRQEDADWKAKRQAHRDTERTWQERSREKRRERRAEHQAQQAQWQTVRAERQARVQQRQAEDAAWRQARQEIRDKLAQLAESAPLVTAWLAILVVVDNGTRRCLGLPLFTVGVHVTAEMVVAALRTLCPPELQFVISDNGAQFIAEAFAQFAQEMAFVHVRIAPYRARTNGIAERFVRTLKEWLETHSWNSPEELAALLVEFIEYYNDRPHQGVELDGLSPNEFARRLANCSTC